MEAAKRFFKGRKNGGELGLGELWMSGAFAGTVNTVVANPVEHIRISTSLLRIFLAGTDRQDYKPNQHLESTPVH
jgi:hypothetical protein